MKRKANFLVIAVLSLLAVFIVEAIEENRDGSKSINVNDELSSNNSTIIENGQNFEAAAIASSIEEEWRSNSAEKERPVTASFGVYLEIVG